MDCFCGRTNLVPRLSDLRHQAGLDAYGKSIAARVSGMIAGGELPRGRECMCCCKDTPASLKYMAECEQLWRKSPTWQIFFVPWLGFVWMFNERGNEDVGRETSVPLSLRICEACRPGSGLQQAAFVLKWAKWLLAALALLLADFRTMLLLAAVVAWSAELVIRRFEQRSLKALFSKEPVYRELFSEFPQCFLAHPEN
jgi:hypothetical protein